MAAAKRTAVERLQDWAMGNIALSPHFRPMEKLECDTAPLSLSYHTRTTILGKRKRNPPASCRGRWLPPA